jgi:hypothetical protein
MKLISLLLTASDLPKISGPIQAERHALARINEINAMQRNIKNARYVASLSLKNVLFTKNIC